VNASRPWWKRKRWVAAAVLLVAFGYPACVAPIFYGAGRGWVPTWVVGVYLGPVIAVAGEPGISAPATWLRGYAHWWGDLGFRHRLAAGE